MHDPPHIRLVDAHPKGHRRHDDRAVAGHPVAQHSVARGLVAPGVEGGRVQTGLPQLVRQPVHRAPQAGVDDPRLTLALPQERNHVLEHVVVLTAIAQELLSSHAVPTAQGRSMDLGDSC